MTLFDYLKDILYNKKGDLLDEQSSKEFQPFLIQRWISMYSPDICNYINDTTNKFWQINSCKEDWYNTFIGIIPKLKFKKIDYIKKIKKEKKEDTKKIVVDFLADNLELSKREINEYITYFDLDINKFKKIIGEK